MKFLQKIDSFATLELLVGIVFIFFIILPIHPLKPVAAFFDSSLGMVVLFALTIFFFLFTNPVLGILFVFVAYELLRRSSLITKNVPILVSPSPSQPSHGIQYRESSSTVPIVRDGLPKPESQMKRDAEMQSLNPPQQRTLEEEVVQKYGPIVTNTPVEFNQPTYLPVISNQIDASLYAS